MYSRVSTISDESIFFLFKKKRGFSLVVVKGKDQKETNPLLYTCFLVITGYYYEVYMTEIQTL